MLLNYIDRTAKAYLALGALRDTSSPANRLIVVHSSYSTCARVSLLLTSFL